LVTLGVAGIVALTVLRRVLRREPDPVIARLILVSLAAKIVGTVAFQRVLTNLYEGVGDTRRYWRVGSELAPLIRSGVLPDQARETGTSFMEFLAGLLFAAIGSNRTIGNLVFSMLAFVGMWLLLQAFRMAIPDGNHRRYAALLLLMPTMLFWTSTLGKEAWLIFTLGIAAYGAARLLQRERFGYLLLAVGIAAMFAVRPHMAALLTASLAGGYLLRYRTPTVQREGMAWVVGLVVLASGTGFVLANYADHMPRDESVDGSGTEQVFSATQQRTTDGGSAFEGRTVRTPADFAHAAMTVPFRPFPTEAHNRQAQLAALEGIALLGFIALALPRIWTLPKQALRRPYVALAGAYSIGFIVAFSNVGNFGLLARQRAQLLPFLLVLLALPKLDHRLQNVSKGDHHAAHGGKRRGALLLPLHPGHREAKSRPAITRETKDGVTSPPSRGQLHDPL
jgi:hypothetical protein